MEGHLRDNLVWFQEVLQWVAAGELVVQVSGVADKSIGGLGRVNVAADDDILDTGKRAEDCILRDLVHNLHPEMFLVTKKRSMNMSRQTLFRMFEVPNISVTGHGLQLEAKTQNYC